MRGFGKSIAAVAVAVASLGSAGVAAVATATASGAALQTCTDSWQGPTTGTTAWNASASNWSTGFPTSTDVVCINLAGTYTVDITADANVSAVQVGGGATGVQTLELDGTSGSNTLSLRPPARSARKGFSTSTPRPTDSPSWPEAAPPSM